jgi:hypothetical protein
MRLHGFQIRLPLGRPVGQSFLRGGTKSLLMRRPLLLGQPSQPCGADLLRAQRILMLFFPPVLRQFVGCGRDDLTQQILDELRVILF